MDYDSSTKFISSLAKFLQSLCNGYVEFDNGVEVIGHIYLSVDTGKKIDYILNEKVCKTDENSVTFISNSFHAQPAEKPKPTSKKSKSDIDSKSQDDLVEVDADSNGQLEPKSTNYGTLPRSANRNQLSPSHRQGKRPSSPKTGRHSPNSKRSKIESQDPSHISDNGLSGQSPATDPNHGASAQGAEGPSLGKEYSDSYQSFSQVEEDNTAEESEERDIKPNIDTDVTFVKEEFAPPSQLGGEGSEERNQIDDANLYSQMYHQPYSGSPGFSNQSFGMHGSSRLSYGADRSDMFDPGQGSSQIEGEGTDPSEMAAESFTTFETRRGGTGIIINGHKFRQEAKFSQTRSFTCIKTKCPSRCKTDLDITTILTLKLPHNHEPATERELQRHHVRQAVKRKDCDDIFTKPAKLIAMEIQTQESTEILPKDYKAIRQALYRQRAKSRRISTPFGHSLNL